MRSLFECFSVVGALLVAGVALAQTDDVPLRNWPAPPFWAAAVTARTDAAPGGPAGPAVGAEAQAASLPSSPVPFTAITPCRIVDTTSPVSDGFHQPNFSSDETRTFDLPSSSDCSGLPLNAVAYSLNVQFRTTGKAGTITVFATGDPMPPTPLLSASSSAWTADAAIVAAGTGGAIDVYCQAAGKVIIDINGYYAPRGVVTSLNTLSGDLTLVGGGSVSITPSGQTITVSGPTALPPAGSAGGSLAGTYPNPSIAAGAVDAGDIASGQVVKSVNGLTDNLTIAGGAGVSVTDGGGTITIAASGGGGSVPSGSAILGRPGDTTLVGAGYNEAIPYMVDGWTPTSLVGAPSPRFLHTAVWTGTQMIVWGGGNPQSLNDGGRYDPATDSWTPTSTINAPTPRSGHTAVWTGTQMIVWGGLSLGPTYDADGGKYDPVADTWTPTGTVGGPQGRWEHAAFWDAADGVMLVWGGLGPAGALNDGGRMRVGTTDSWGGIVTLGAPSARYYFAGAWTGSEMIVWGGLDGTNALSDGARYSMSTFSWTPLPSSPLLARVSPLSVWTGSTMLVWGGGNGNNTQFNDGAAYDPGANSWSRMGSSGAPAKGVGTYAVWTGSRMVVWGGPDTSGGIYSPAADTWSPTSTRDAPSNAGGSGTAVWTGQEMIVWGGFAPSGLVPTSAGGRWHPYSLYIKN